MKVIGASLAAILVLTGLAHSQSSPLREPSGQRAPAEGHGLPGKLPGTEQWIAHFKKRSFDLSGLRSAIQSGKSAEEVEAIVADLQVRVIADQASFVKALKTLDGRAYIQYWLVNCCAIEVPFANLAAVRKLPNVDHLEPNVPVYPLIKTSTSAANHNSDAVNLGGDVGKGIAAAIVDTGLDSSCGSKARPHRTFYEHGDLTKRNRLLANKQMGLISADNSHPHGTGVAGIAVGGDWRNSGADDGHAPAADIVGYSLSNSTTGGSDPATMAKAWQEVAKDATRYNIKTANNSYSGSRNANPLTVIQKALDTTALTADVFISVAAGNSAGSTSVSQPAINGISVGALNPTAHTVASFSSRGPHAGVAGMYFPDISACGVGTVMPDNDNENNNYVASGTSMASPQVCGAATLIRAAVPTLKASETKAILLATALDISQQNQSAPYNSRNAYGMGMVKDDAAMVLARDTSNHGMAKVTTATNSWQKVAVVKRGHTYRAAIAWMRQDVNSTNWSNLDVEILQGSTVIASSTTPKNASEVAIFRSPINGVLFFRVKGVTIEKGSQDFGWAFTEGSGPPIEAKYSSFGAGCPGASQGCSACFKTNWTLNLDNKTTTATKVGILEYSVPKTNVCGIDLYTRSQAGSVSVQVDIQDFDVRSALPGKLLRSGTVQVGATAGIYTATFPALAVGQTQLLVITINNADKLILPVSKTGQTQPHYEFRNNKWNPTLFSSHNWMYRVHCDRGFQSPVLMHEGVPVIGGSFKLNLTAARSNSAAVLLFGASDKNWGALALPFTYASGCQLLVSADQLVQMPTGGTGTASVQVPVPNSKDLVNLVLFNQFLVVDPVNSVGLVSSNAGRASIGEFGR